MKFLLIFFTGCFISNFCLSQLPGGIFQDHTDIGNPKYKGSVKYDNDSQTYTLTGSGYNIWFNRDEFQYVYKKIGGDFIATANFKFEGEAKEGHRKTGWMVRESTDAQAAHISAVKHGDGLIVLQWRTMREANMRDPQDEIFSTIKGTDVIQMERAGKKIIMRIAHNGEPLQEVGSHEMTDMKDSVLLGLFICSHDSDKIETAKIWNVRIDKPIANTNHPNPDVAVNISSNNDVPGSRLKMMNVFAGERKVVYKSAGLLFHSNSFQFY
jgi:hypothetical protein